MPKLAVLPFADEHVEAAAELLAARHRRHREAEPLLPARYEDPAVARDEIAALREAENASGVVGVRDGRVVGYLVGDRRDDDLWGANVWVELAGHAVEAPEDVRDLYAHAAAAWVEAGRTMHYAIAPAADKGVLDAWFRLGFGQQHALGVREVDDAGAETDGVRIADESDLEALVALAPTLSDHQALSPVFSRGETWTEEEVRADIVDDLARDDVDYLVAEREGEIVASFALTPVELSSTHAGMARPDGACLLAWAASRSDVRGSGAGLALTDASFAWARTHGYEVMVTDWRVTNLLSSRFWPRRGFRETFLRLHRAVVPR